MAKIFNDLPFLYFTKNQFKKLLIKKLKIFSNTVQFAYVFVTANYFL